MKPEVFAYEAHLRRPLRTARGVTERRAGWVVALRDRDGREGLGEAAPLPPWTEGSDSTWAALQSVRDLDADAPVKSLEQLDGRDLGPAARHALASALLDLAAQQAGQPLCTFLGRDYLGRAVAPRPLALNAVVGAGEPAQAAEEARAAVRGGYRAVKVKLAGTAERDAALAAAVREAVGPDAELRLDANGAWNPAEAAARLRAVAASGPAYVEQPLRDVPVTAMAALRAERIVPIAADESAATVEDARLVLEQEACDVLVVKPMALGGPDRAVEVLARAEARGVPVVVSGLLDGAVARAAAAHVAMLAPAPALACGLQPVFARDIAEGARVRRGLLDVGRGAGLGVRREGADA